MRYSIVEYMGPSEEGTCGYCHQERSMSAVIGMWAPALAVSHYNGLLDRGMRRSGRYLYKPIIEKTCCPQYTIRLDVHRFKLSRTQKRVLRYMNEYLLYDKKPKYHTGEEAAETSVRYMQKRTENIEKDKQKCISQKHDEVPSALHTKNLKKKNLRKQRAIERLKKKGIDVEEFQCRRREKEFARQRTLESYLLDYDENKFRHKLEIRLIRVDSEEFNSTFRESYELFVKYQTTVHKQTDCTEKGYRSFLANSPLFSDEEKSSAPKSVELGSYHQQYILDGKIIAVGVVDILPRCFSAKYFYYDPDYMFLSLGTYSALREIAFVRELAKERPALHYYYMGYYIVTCPKMRYKGRFRPADLLCDVSFTWVPLEDCLKRLKESGENAPAFNPNAERPPRFPVEQVRCLYNGKLMSYYTLCQQPDFKETQNFMEDYALLVGPLAGEMVLYRW
ncbi:hypothetical protein AB6A40_004252 [Gnathostoma spinigerum]|uniref:Arginyl-tRNA--protein transferase 1 n=1 Tax=Gnathostoma spinigerum TaxID=75299 RepID=A0ABD6EBY5_9BILA